MEYLSQIDIFPFWYVPRVLLLPLCLIACNHQGVRGWWMSPTLTLSHIPYPQSVSPFDWRGQETVVKGDLGRSLTCRLLIFVCVCVCFHAGRLLFKCVCVHGTVRGTAGLSPMWRHHQARVTVSDSPRRRGAVWVMRPQRPSREVRGDAVGGARGGRGRACVCLCARQKHFIQTWQRWVWISFTVWAAALLVCFLTWGCLFSPLIRGNTLAPWQESRPIRQCFSACVAHVSAAKGDGVWYAHISAHIADIRCALCQINRAVPPRNLTLSYLCTVFFSGYCFVKRDLFCELDVYMSGNAWNGGMCFKSILSCAGKCFNPFYDERI